MIILYRKHDCPFCDEIEEAFREVVLAYKIGTISDLPVQQSKKLPLIVEGGKHYFGEKAIRGFVEESKKLMADWQKFQSDSCYLGDDGKVC